MQIAWMQLIRPRLPVLWPIAALIALPLVLMLTLMVTGAFADGGPAEIHGSHFLIGLAVYLVAAVAAVRIGLSRLSQLEALGLTDSLCNVPNRRALHLDTQQRTTTGEDIAVAMIDLDGFKSVNDQYGHAVGDRVIRECTRLMGEICAGEASHYRLGGDEFAVVVIGPLAGNILEGICHKLLAALQSPLIVDDRRIRLGASIGLTRSSAEYPLSSSELLRRADVAMYVSKELGKNRCTWFKEEFDQRREERKQIENDLRRGLERGEFRLLYQPLVDAKTREVVAVEALIRWERPDGLRMGPDVFIPIAEESGLIGPIGLWVLQQGCRDALNWGNVKLSVNVSAAQLRNPEFPIQLGQVLEETGFPPARLELEVTETYLVGDPTVAGRSLEMVRSFGVGVVLDDFGTGYASIGFLRKFCFGKLKLDRSLVVESASDMGSHAMMVSSIAVARAMDMDVTAEGIETEAQADMVRAAGCDQMQGWLYYRAITADEIGAIVSSEDPDIALTGT